MALYFVDKQQTDSREEVLPLPGRREVRVGALLSGISAGTEMLLYGGQAPAEMEADPLIPFLSGPLCYPRKYGYSVVGRISELGTDVENRWEDRLVFAFHPHQDSFIARIDDLLPVPADITAEDAVFLPSMETAVSLVMDGHPVIGESAVILGQGIIGLLTTGLLSAHPLSSLIAMDSISLRRRWALRLGADLSLDPDLPDWIEQIENVLNRCGNGKSVSLEQDGADVVYELSGNPMALDLAVKCAGYGARIIVGSWYGKDKTVVDLGRKFHRGRVQIKSSQVSTIDPSLTGRWTKTRRGELAWQMIRRLKPSRLISHIFPFSAADRAYKLLSRQKDGVLQVLLAYDRTEMETRTGE